MFELHFDPVEQDTDRYLDECSRADEENDREREEYERLPICCKCGDHIESDMITDYIYVHGARIEVPFHKSCYNDGFEGGNEWYDCDIKFFGRGK